MEFFTEAIGLYLTSLHLFINPTVILLLLIGTAVGIVWGALPGLTSTMALAVVTPLTFGLEASEAIVLLIAVYNGSVYGGSLSAILINIPGTPSSLMTMLDGHPMAKRGEAGRAIGLATTASFLGAIFGMLVLVLAAPAIAQVALKFGSMEFALLALLGLSLIAYISGTSLAKGLIAGLIGLLIASIGQDPVSAFPRFTLGMADLVGGVELIPVLIGFFGVTEIFKQIDLGLAQEVITQKISGLFSVFSDLKKLWGVIFRSASIGSIIGAIPATGPSIAAITSYAVQKQFSKNPGKLGTGLPEGIVAPESANNACVGGALIPTLTLGIPGDSMTAVLIGSLLFHGLAPGPLLFVKHADFVSAIFLTLTLSSVLILVLGFSTARLFARFLSVPQFILMPAIMVLCVVGSYAIRLSLFDVSVTVICGLLGYLLNKVDIPVAPIVLGIILGPMLEDNFRRALMLSGGSLVPFITRPFSLIIILLIVLVLTGPLIQGFIRKRRNTKNIPQ